MSPEQAIREAEKRGAVEALRSAAVDWEALVQREKPPIRGSLWLRNRADRLDAQDGGEGRG